jgi:HK97 family phage major capsid protein
MKKSDELKQKRAALIEEQQNIVRSAEKENRSFDAFTEEENTSFAEKQAEIDKLNKSIKLAEQAEANATFRASKAVNPVTTETVDGEAKELNKNMKRYSLHKALRSQLGKGNALDGVELEMHQEMTKRAQESGVAISGLAVPTALPTAKRADGQTVTQDAGAYGANLVGEDLQQPIEFLRPTPVIQSLGARYFTGLSGNVAFPTNDGGISAAWEGEIDTTAKTKNAYGKKTMSPNRLASTVLVSMQNLFQSSIDLERYTIEEINAVIANALDVAAINGSGSGQPEGILNASGTNAVVGGVNGAAPTWDHIVDMETQVYIGNANSASMAYLINPATKGKLKKTKHSAGDLNYLMAMDNSINGYPVAVSNHVPADLTKGTADPVSAAIFGDFSQLIIGQWGFYDLDVFKDAQVGNVNITVNSFFDVMVRQAKAFSVVKDWDLSA